MRTELVGNPYLYLTFRCPFRCNFCYTCSGPDRTGTEVSTERTFEIMDYFTGGKILTVSGGEPLLHPGAGEILKRAAEKFTWVTVFTNGQPIYGDIGQQRALIRSKLERFLDTMPENIRFVFPVTQEHLRQGNHRSFITVAAEVAKKRQTVCFFVKNSPGKADGAELIKDFNLLGLENPGSAFPGNIIAHGRAFNLYGAKVLPGNPAEYPPELHLCYAGAFPDEWSFLHFITSGKVEPQPQLRPSQPVSVEDFIQSA
jgi:organic radical activating enzyme